MTDDTPPTGTAVRMEELTWTDVRAALAAGTTTAVVPVGSTEQHGPHMPLGMDAIYGEELAVRIAVELGDALVAPPVRPGCSGHHMAFPGTITVPPELLMDLVRAYCRSLSSHGFEYLVLLPSHGGNFAPVSTVAPEIARELDAGVVALADLDRLLALFNEGLREVVDYEEPVVHAGAAETALLLALRPELVREDRLEAGHEGEVPAARLFAEGFDYFTDNGVLGDARKATVEAGEQIADAIVTDYVERIESEREALE